jgi:Zn-dependent peptidase ImmA (M78 family)/transcriptional regulator with XRE-family HTH domain
MSANEVTISGRVLSWAIETSGLSRQAVSEKLNVTAQVVANWERGEAKPTRGQFTALAEVLKRPRATFFLPEPPVEHRKRPDLRRPPSNPHRGFTADEVGAMKGAHRLQDALSWALNDQPDPEVPTANVEEAPDVAAARVRAWLGVSIRDQVAWGTESLAFRGWRSALEAKGVFAFQLSMGPNSCRGFSSWDRKAPVVVVNSAYSMGARSFTLMHELGHLVTKTDSVCTSFTVSDGLDADSTYERWCERFSAAVLMPRPALTELLQQRFAWREGLQVVSTLAETVRIATYFNVSLRAAAMRVLDLGAGSRDLYRTVDAEALVRDRNQGGGGGGDRRPAVRLREYGARAFKVLQSARRADRLSKYDYADYFDVPPADVGELERFARVG